MAIIAITTKSSMSVNPGSPPGLRCFILDPRVSVLWLRFHITRFFRLANGAPAEDRHAAAGSKRQPFEIQNAFRQPRGGDGNDAHRTQPEHDPGVKQPV